MRLQAHAALAAAVLTAVGCASGTEDSDGAGDSGAPEPVTVTLAEANGSGRSGTATISEGPGGSIDVAVEMDDEGGGLPVIHGLVRCSELSEHPERGAVHSLKPLVEGRSETNVEFPVEHGKALLQVATGGNYFAVHESTSIDRVVACGEIPFR